MQPPKYNFYLNPHDEYAWTKCPKCDEKTKLRKFCLMVHYQDKPSEHHRLLSIRMDCRFCPDCELIIKRKSEIESSLQQTVPTLGMKFSPDNYFVFGTVGMADWKENQKTPMLPPVILEQVSAFKDFWDFNIQPAGWYFEGK